MISRAAIRSSTALSADVAPASRPILRISPLGTLRSASDSGKADVADLHAKRNSLIANTALRLTKQSSPSDFHGEWRYGTRCKGEATPPSLLKVAGDEFRPVDEQSIRELFAPAGHSQKQLSAVGVRGDELLRFVQAPITRKLDDIRRNAEDDVATLRSAYLQLMRKRKIQAEIMRYEIEQGSLEKQLDALRQGLKGLSNQDRQILKNAELYATEQSVFEGWALQIRAFTDAVVVLRSTGHFPRPNPSLATLPNAELLTDTESLVRKLFASIDDRLAEIERLLKDSPDSKRFFELQQEWHTRKNAHDTEYQGVKDRATEHEAVIKQIADLQERAKSLRTTIADRQTVYASFGDVETQFKDIKGHWFSLLELRASLLAERCGAISDFRAA